MPDPLKAREVQRRLAARRRRARTLKLRAGVVAAVMFAMVWVGVFGQLVSGQDPALGSGRKATAIKAASVDGAAETTDAETNSSLENFAQAPPVTSAPVQTAPAPAPTPTPVITRQS